MTKVTDANVARLTSAIEEQKARDSKLFGQLGNTPLGHIFAIVKADEAGRQATSFAATLTKELLKDTGHEAFDAKTAEGLSYVDASIAAGKQAADLIKERFPEIDFEKGARRDELLASGGHTAAEVREAILAAFEGTGFTVTVDEHSDNEGELGFAPPEGLSDEDAEVIAREAISKAKASLDRKAGVVGSAGDLIGDAEKVSVDNVVPLPSRKRLIDCEGIEKLASAIYTGLAHGRPISPEEIVAVALSTGIALGQTYAGVNHSCGHANQSAQDSYLERALKIVKPFEV